MEKCIYILAMFGGITVGLSGICIIFCLFFLMGGDALNFIVCAVFSMMFGLLMSLVSSILLVIFNLYKLFD